MAPMLTAQEIREANTAYHDVAAEHYDSKWGIDFGPIGRHQVRGKLEKALGGRAPRFARSLEIGSGTGYFTLNLMLEGLIEHATCSDISPGMLETLAANAQRLGLEVTTRVADAERLPFDDESFDLIIGHAVLHHIPDLERAMHEFDRVLAPGGMLVFAGEPSRHGDRIAGVPKRAAKAAAPLWRAALRAGPAPAPAGGEEEERLERVVDVHAFDPATLRAAAAQAGFEEIRITGEELLANWFGWTNRTLEATADPDQVPRLWRQFAFRGYVALQRVDGSLLEGRLPPAIFYNLLLSARKAPERR